MTRDQFLKGVDNFDNHRNLLWPALEATSDTQGLVMELGMGHGSTPFLAEYCDATGRELISFESSEEWLHKFKSSGKYSHSMFLVKDWDIVFDNWSNPDVLLLDQAPGERRMIDLQRFAKSAKIVVLHDSEPAADHGYKCRQYFGLYQYVIDFESPGAWATALSNFVDVTKWKNALPHDNR